MRIRTKECFNCTKEKSTLYRCQYQQREWAFICGGCLEKIKVKFEDSYKYGGTWKSAKKS